MSARGTAVLRRVARVPLGIDDSAGGASTQFHSELLTAVIGRGGAPIARQISVVVVNIVAVQYTAFEVLTLCDCCEFAEQK